MSANYSIWHGEQSSDWSACYLTAINVQELGHLNATFFADLWMELDVPVDPTITDWELSPPFAVEYLSSDRTPDWHDSWLLTWQLVVRGHRLPLPVDPVDVTVWDKTWSGAEASPRRFEVIAGDTNSRSISSDTDESVSTCPLGHFHIGVSVEEVGLEVAAERARAISAKLQSVGLPTLWLDSLSRADDG